MRQQQQQQQHHQNQKKQETRHEKKTKHEKNKLAHVNIWPSSFTPESLEFKKKLPAAKFLPCLSSPSASG